MRAASCIPDAQIHDELLAFAAAPGKFLPAIKQPAGLFASIPAVLNLAAGRLAAGEQANGRLEEICRAARFFVKTALLYPGADHYSVFGLSRDFDAAQVKERYRLLMRLIHPDFAGRTETDWPSDAAVRVNLAYEVLSSPVRRREYEQKRQAAAAISLGEPKTLRAAPQPGHRISRSRLKTALLVLSAPTIALVAALLWNGAEPVTIVQRTPATPATTPDAGPTPTKLATAGRRVNALEPSAPAPSDLQVRQRGELPAPRAHGEAAVVPRLAVAQQYGSGATSVREQRDIPKPAALENTLAALPSEHATRAISPPRAAVAVAGSLTAATPSVSASHNEASKEPFGASPVATLGNRITSPAPLQPVVAQSERLAEAAVLAPADAAASAQRVAPKLAPLAATAKGAFHEPGPAVPILKVSLTDAQPLLSELLGQLESGRADSFLRLVDEATRSAPGPTRLGRVYDSMVNGAGRVRISNVRFRAEPKEARLLVTGSLRVHTSRASDDGVPMSFIAEFASRQGKIVLVDLRNAD